MSTPPTWPPPPPSSLPPIPGAPGAPAAPPGMAPPPQKKAAPVVAIVIIGVALFFGGIAVLGIVAAIAIPGFVRARMSANEAVALARVRAMVSAQMTWASLHDGRFAEPSCLADPPSCGDAQGSIVLPREAASLEPRNGYDAGFVLRPSAPDDEGAAAGSDTGGFTFWATPSTPDVTGRRAFCVGENGVVLEYLDARAWTAPTDARPQCPDGGRPLR